MSFLTVQGIRILQVLVASTVVLTLFFSLGHFGSDNLRDNVKVPARQSNLKLPFRGRAPQPKPANATLDFQEIIFLSMPYRTDRQDALSLIAAVTGLKLTMIPGVSGSEIHPKAMPPYVGNKNITGSPALGIWRAHANVWRYIIDNNIQSALIIEDDVDWDVNIKEIMGTLNWNLRYNNTIRWGKDNVKKGWKEDCPYGCDWDELFVGHCGGAPNQKRLDLHQIIPDPHSPEIASIKPWAQKEITTMWNQTESAGQRIIAPTWEPVCLMGYGLSRMGAMRMLYQIGGWKPFGNPVDNEIAFRTSAGVLSGYTMMPPAFVPWRVGGSQDSDNDERMKAQAVQSMGNVEGKSVGLKNSVRKSLEGHFKKNYWEEMKNERR